VQAAADSQENKVVTTKENPLRPYNIWRQLPWCRAQSMKSPILKLRIYSPS